MEVNIKGYTADNLFMEMKEKGEDQKIMRSPTLMKSKKINSTTIRTIFDPVKVGNFDIRYLIMMEDVNIMM